MTMAARLSPVTARLSGVVGPEVFADLTWNQIAELNQSIADTAGNDASAEKLGAVVEATSPELAKKFRSQSRQEITGYANLVLVVLQLMLQIYSTAHSVTPVQVNQIINHIESTTIMVNPAPAPYTPTIRKPLAAPPPTPRASPHT